MENKGENILRKVRRHPIELRTVSSCARTGDFKPYVLDSTD